MREKPEKEREERWMLEASLGVISELESALSMGAPPLSSRMNWSGLTSVKSWSGKAALRVAMRRQNVRLADWLSRDPNGLSSTVAAKGWFGDAALNAISSCQCSSMVLYSRLSFPVALHE